MRKWKPLLVGAGLGLAWLASGAMVPWPRDAPTGDDEWLRAIGPNGLAWLELATPDGTGRCSSRMAARSHHDST